MTISTLKDLRAFMELCIEKRAVFAECDGIKLQFAPLAFTAEAVAAPNAPSKPNEPSTIINGRRVRDSVLFRSSGG